MIRNERVTGVAAYQDASPSCDAVSTQEPPEIKFTLCVDVDPTGPVAETVTVHTDGVSDAKVMSKLEVVLAVTEVFPPDVYLTFAGWLKVIT